MEGVIVFNLDFEKTINNITKLDKELRVLNSVYLSVSSKGSAISLTFSRVLTQPEIDAVSNKINTFVETDLVDYLQSSKVIPVNNWVQNFLQRTTAENISMGITQAGKAADMLGFYQMYTLLPGSTLPCTFKGSLDTGSLNVTIALIDYYIANPTLWSGLEPFVSASRMTAWKADIIKYLTT